MSACLATAMRRAAYVGVHGTTFGGNPLAMAIGNATLDVILAPGFLNMSPTWASCCGSVWPS